MSTSALQEFLHRLGDSLAAIGVPPKALDGLRAVGQALDPFRDLDLDQLADFLRRAAEFRRRGDIPAVSVPGLDNATAAARELGEAVQAVHAGDHAADGVEDRVNRGKRDLQAALAALAGRFGMAVKFSDDKKWLAGLRAKGIASRTADAFRRVAPQIIGPESYQDETVRTAIDELAGTDPKVLKAAATDLGVSGTGAGRSFVESVLAKLTGIGGRPTRPGKKAKAEEPVAPDEQVDAMVKELQEMVARAKDPNAVPDAEVEAILTRVGGGFADKQQKSIAQRVTGKSGKSAKEAIDRLRADLTAVKRLMEGQRV